LKSDAVIDNGQKRPGRKASGITTDRKIMLTGNQTSLRQINYIALKTNKELRFVTHADHLDAKTIAELYKERWQIELFFKLVKQNLKVKTFLGT
jgi:putative transposase